MRVVVLIAAVATLAACGGKEKPAQDAGGDYRDRAQRACRSADATLGSIDPVAPERGTRAWAAAVRALEAVEPPAARREQQARVVEAARELDRALRKAERVARGRELAKRELDTLVRARSAADSLRIAGREAGLAGCGDGAEAAADRLLGMPYLALASNTIAGYRRTMREADFTPETADDLGRSLVAIYSATVPFHREFGVLEPPSVVGGAHDHVIETLDPTIEVLAPLVKGDLPLGDDGRRTPRRFAPIDRRVRRAQSALLAKLERELGL